MATVFRTAAWFKIPETIADFADAAEIVLGTLAKLIGRVSDATIA